ncbi:MAG: class I SAM-dependent methyltransferase [Desulfovibrionaceae bacterium]
MKIRDKVLSRISPSFKYIYKLYTLLQLRGSGESIALRTNAILFNMQMYAHPLHTEVFEMYKKIDELVLQYLPKTPLGGAQRSLYDYPVQREGYPYPGSITPEEGMILMGVILENSLKLGYEVATAFGISSLYIASALKKTGGSVTSIDCYIEETAANYTYTVEDIKRHTETVKNSKEIPIGLETARKNSKLLHVEECINYVIGVTPYDVEENVPDALEFVLIDGAHTDGMPLEDFHSIKDKVSKNKCAIFFHDASHFKDIDITIKEAEAFFGVKSVRLDTFCKLTVIPLGISMGYIEMFKKTRT